MGIRSFNIAGNSIIIALIIIVTIVLDHKFFMPPKGTIEVKPPIVTPTTWTDKEHAKNTSPLQITGKMDKDLPILGVDCYDNEKRVHADFPISCKPDHKRHIVQISYLFQYHENKFYSSYSAVYLHNFGRAAIGGGAIGSNQSIGLQVVGQINF
jgi:hypothetical protein